MDDLISRQAAIDALMVAIDDVGILDSDDIKVVFDNLPSADVQPVRHGTWMEENRRPRSILYRCSVCREIAHDRPYGSLKREPKKTCKMKYCPHCGAKMESEEIT